MTRPTEGRMMKKILISSIIIIVFLFICGVSVYVPITTKWKTKLGDNLIEFQPLDEKSYQFGLRSDGIVVWKYTDKQYLENMD